MSGTNALMYLLEKNYLVRRNEDLFIKISEKKFESLSDGEASELLYYLSAFITNENLYLEHFPAFLLKEKEILLSVSYNVWEKEDEEIDKIKNVLLNSAYTKSLDFMLELLHCDDGSLALIVADLSLKSHSDFWIAVLTRWHNAPNDVLSTAVDYNIVYDSVPENLKNDSEFNLKLISLVPGFYHALSDTLKNNAEIAGIVLKYNGMMLMHMPDPIRENPDLAYIAICQNNKAVEFISDNLTYDVDFIKKTIDANPDVLAYSISRMRYLYHNPKST